MKTPKKEPKQYEIDSFEKLCNVINSENYKAITMDLVMWLGYHVDFIEKIRKEHPEFTKDKTNFELFKSSFIWIDDGKNDFKEVVVKNESTGEVRRISVKKKK
jgi:hypothetical protein